MTLAEFVTTYTGAVWDFDKSYGPQCADLVNFYNQDVLGAPQFPGANAVNFYGELSDWFDWIPNAPDNFPSAGDVVVWDKTFGNGNGHTAIALPGATKSAFPSLDQNWGPVVTHIVLHTYKGVLGWGHPKDRSMLPGEFFDTCVRDWFWTVTGRPVDETTKLSNNVTEFENWRAQFRADGSNMGAVYLSLWNSDEAKAHRAKKTSTLSGTKFTGTID